MPAPPASELDVRVQAQKPMLLAFLESPTPVDATVAANAEWWQWRVQRFEPDVGDSSQAGLSADLLAHGVVHSLVWSYKGWQQANAQPAVGIGAPNPLDWYRPREFAAVYAPPVNRMTMQSTATIGAVIRYAQQSARKQFPVCLDAEPPRHYHCHASHHLSVAGGSCESA